ncbi:bifunctional 3-(3-hydroxy-phenyl)propionate/3-hydroxycinnamic acid hydroxylase MhpA [Burkholderia cenocepacia]|uniref:bifunctional 3-(3-hydroxy-phenyl)propionate/3-hydroxycinnamic acid hydroxylase MhpA n=1 Tax=Burkholderia cenocepacia TaxID=95486 RepID=UPI002876A49E|nr:bifunctional 3-(3-hydroxy-phenyl)propionate/3-hydroxycinnamic acid hydroxylase [Burkholderia cenocepacia]MDS0803605.1 bifunctional 3-(3-hydroxy-phenyl)propionate/3-hydroxycinnamic acid hydroxylase [Burkholderia cenocepacia]
MTNADVVIVGAGPVGLWSAVLLGRRGLNVLLCDRWPEFYPLPRACGIDHEVVRMLQSADLGETIAPLLDPIIGADKTYEFVDGQGERLLEVQWNRPGRSGWAQMNLFFQPDVERHLDACLREMSNVRILRGRTATKLKQDAEGVEVHLKTSGGIERIRGRYLIGADGANSFVRSTVDIAQTDLGIAYDWLVIDVVPKVQRQWKPYVVQHCDVRRPATSVGSGPGRRRWEFMRMPGESLEELNSAGMAWKLLAPWDITPETATLERHAVYTFRGRWAQRWQERRVFLAGDSAHLMPPFLAQGLCSGMRDATALAWRLGMVLQDDASTAILETYTQERLTHVREIIEQAVELGKVICMLDPEDARNRDEQMKMALENPSLALKPPPEPRLGQPGILNSGDPQSGYLGVQGSVRKGGRTGLLDDLIGRGWQLISNVDDPRRHLSDVSLQLAERLGLVTAYVGAPGTEALFEDIHGVYQNWFAQLRAQAVLVRPDFYVYGVANLDSLDVLLGGLGEKLGWVHATA